MTKKYVVLEHLTMPDQGKRFWSTNTENNTHSLEGELWYKEIIFTDDKDEAIHHSSLYGNLPTHRMFDEYLQEKYNLK